MRFFFSSNAVAVAQPISAAAVAPQRTLEAVVDDGDAVPDDSDRDWTVVEVVCAVDPPKLVLGSVEVSGLEFAGNGNESLESNKSAGGLGNAVDDLLG